jgi:type VI protein secretion system component Hcp
LRIPGVPGESKVQGHVDDIELISYAECRDQGVSQGDRGEGARQGQPRTGVARGHEPGHPHGDDLPQQVGDAPIDFFTAVLENVVVGTVELVEVDGGLTPTERVTLLPTRATLTYVQKPDGSPGPTSTSLITCP